MGKPTGFKEYKRKTAGYRPVNKRIQDYKDVAKNISNTEIQTQAARCMDCGVPFCHASGCPVFNLIPEWNDLVYKGRWEDALERLLKTNTLPEITGRICPAPCETACTLSINNAPVTIKQIELAIIEYGFKKGLVKPVKPRKKTGKKVAIIGSGPAGLAAAQVLRAKGHDVTVYERSDKAGGILRYGIPDFKLEKWVIDRRLKIMEESGIKFKTNVDVGSKITASYLKKNFDSVLLTVGAGHPRDLLVEGRELNGIYFAMDYLKGSNKYAAGDVKMKDIISAKGKNVLVVGGGDTGSDCIGTARRQGAKNICQFEIMPKPEEWKNAWNPSWPDWPLILRTSSSQEEGVERDWSITTKKFTGKNDKVKETHFTRAEWKKNKKTNRFELSEIPESDFSLKIDLVLLAMGFVHVEHLKLFKDMSIECDTRGNIRTDDTYATCAPGVFAAGDADIGASLVVRAIYHGQEAAAQIDKYLS
jgi:glutamate synthase (NADPH/NADH) small chain